MNESKTESNVLRFLEVNIGKSPYNIEIGEDFILKNKGKKIKEGR